MEPNRLTVAEKEAAYERPPSFTQHIPIRSYSSDWDCFVFDDGAGLGALLTLRPTDAEARPQEQLEQILDSLENAPNALLDFEKSTYFLTRH